MDKEFTLTVLILGLAGLLALGLLVGAIFVWPLAVGAAFVGWLIGGQIGAAIGLAVAGIVGWIFVALSQ